MINMTYVFKFNDISFRDDTMIELQSNLSYNISAPVIEDDGVVKYTVSSPQPLIPLICKCDESTTSKYSSDQSFELHIYFNSEEDKNEIKKYFKNLRSYVTKEDLSILYNVPFQIILKFKSNETRKVIGWSWIAKEIKED